MPAQIADYCGRLVPGTLLKGEVKAMIIKLIIGNLLFAAMIWGYYLYVDGNRDQFLHGALLIAIAFISGTLVGAWLGRASARPKPTKKTIVNRQAFDQIR